jgi:hypothetical protein
MCPRTARTAVHGCTDRATLQGWMFELPSALSVSSYGRAEGNGMRPRACARGRVPYSYFAASLYQAGAALGFDA